MLFTPQVGDGDIVKGHYARLAYQIKKEKRESDGPHLTLDAGDFFAGTLFHALAPNRKINFFPEAEFFKLMNYDATTFGNHEFDARDEGLEIMLDKWVNRKVTTAIVATNSYFQNKNPNLEKHFGMDKIVKPYLIKTLVSGDKELRVAIIGFLGPDGALVSLGSRRDVGFVGFDDKKSKEELGALSSALKPLIKKLKESEKVQVIIGLMHGGHPEDVQILEDVPEINLLIAGHTHKVYPRPLKIGNSLLVQAGCFGQFLGKLKLKWDGSALTVTNQDTILEINDSLPTDPEMESVIYSYKKELDQIFKKTGLRYDSFIFTAKQDYIRRKESSNELGVLITSGVREELNKTIDEDIQIYFTSLGLIRKDILKDRSYQLSDIFKIMAIGFDEKLEPGPKVVSFYLNKKEVFNLVNFMEVYGMLSAKFTPAFSNTLSYKNRWWGIPFLNKIGDLKLNGMPYSKWPELINVSTSQYVAAYLPKVQSMSYGLLEFIPKDKNGSEIKTPIIHEEKEYTLLAKYLKGKKSN